METAVEDRTITMEIRLLNATGDDKHIWNPDDEASVDANRKLFEDLTKKGYVAYKVKRNGDPGELMKKFDVEAGSLILVRPPQAGG